MNWLDLALLIPLLLSALIGFFRGFVRESFSLVTWIIAIWLGWQHAPQHTAWIPDVVNDATLRLGIAFVVIFVLVLIVGGILGVLARRLIHGIGLAGIDRVLGFGFGSLRGVLILALAVFLGSLTLLPQESWWQESRLIPPLQRVVDWTEAQLPESARQRFREWSETYRMPNDLPPPPSFPTLPERSVPPIDPPQSP